MPRSSGTTTRTKPPTPFIEDYGPSQGLRYPPYPDAAGVSHAHGWATTPTFALISHGAGLEVTAASGRERRVLNGLFPACSV